MQRRKIRFTRGARFSQPFAQLPCFIHRRYATRARKRERNERIGRAVSDKRRLQCRLFTQIKSQEKIEFHFVAVNFFPI